MFHYAKKQKGMILIIVLVFMQLVAMFSWYALANILYAHKTSEMIKQHYQIFNTAVNILHQAGQDLVTTIPQCLISPVDQQQLLTKSIDWWQSDKTCAGNFQRFKYYYVVEALGDDPCASIENIGSTANYFRLTLFVSSPSHIKLFLQSTVIRPSDLRQQCQGQSHLVRVGPQAWTELA